MAEEGIVDRLRIEPRREVRERNADPDDLHRLLLADRRGDLALREQRQGDECDDEREDVSHLNTWWTFKYVPL